MDWLMYPLCLIKGMLVFICTGMRIVGHEIEPDPSGYGARCKHCHKKL